MVDVSMSDTPIRSSALTDLQQKPTFDHEFDLVIVGSGAGGLTAALTAASSGKQSVLVAEKTRWFGGTSAFSGGAIWVPMNPQSLQQGYKDSREQAERYLRNYLKDDYDEPLISAYLESAPEMVRWLEDIDAARFVPCPTPDYYMHVDGALKAGRTLLNAPYDGRNLGKMVRQVRYPLQGYCAFGSMQTDLMRLDDWKRPLASWKKFSFVAKSLLRYAMDQVRYGKGTALCNGNALVGRLLESATKLGVELWPNAPAPEPILQNGKVVGMVVTKNGRSLRIRAKKGVILASGGFARSTDLSRKYLPNQDWTVGPRGNQGDGLRIGEASGGKLPPPLGDNAALWTPISEFRPKHGPVRTYPHFSMGLTKPGSIIVDSGGNRFANESSSYQDFGKATHAAGVRKEYLIGDRRHLRSYGMGVALPAPYPLANIMRRDYLTSASTIADLAVKIGLDPSTLIATVNRFNEFARNGKDLDFGRGEASYDQMSGDSNVTPNPCLAPLDKGPFYAIRMYPGHGVTMYGLETNRDGQVMNASNIAVPGLYAAGADANHLMKGHYPSGGLTLGPSLVFGYRAALHACRSQ